MNTRKYPRSTSEAFKDADYASSVTAFRGPMHFADKLVTWVSAIGIFCLVGMIAVGWVK